MNVIKSFSGKFWFLSNFYRWPILVPHRFKQHSGAWPTTEHAFQAFKFTDRDYIETIRAAEDPSEAKALGRTREVPIREGWDDVRLFVMSMLIEVKFAPMTTLNEVNPLALNLLKTGNAELIEGNTWKDRFWGMTAPGIHHGLTGHNWLGKILMVQRSRLVALNSELNNAIEPNPWSQA